MADTDLCGVQPGRGSGGAEVKLLHRVIVSTTLPLSDHHIHVLRQRCLMAPPHLDSRVVGPSWLDPLQSSQDLVRLDTLLAQPAPVQAAGRIHIIGVGKERLHAPILPQITAW